MRARRSSPRGVAAATNKTNQGARAQTQEVGTLSHKPGHRFSSPGGGLFVSLRSRSSGGGGGRPENARAFGGGVHHAAREEGECRGGEGESLQRGFDHRGKARKGAGTDFDSEHEDGGRGRGAWMDGIFI